MNSNQVNLRQAVMDNVHDSTPPELRETIIDAIESGEDKTLPGLGVLFEVLWNGSNPLKQNEIIQSIHEGLKRK
ncbi:MAG TPA: small acid-soluble spore protein SspI [Bacillota bacterium]|nr:small acid-soluble spore protein SspI [Bacillota bacterium]